MKKQIILMMIIVGAIALPNVYADTDPRLILESDETLDRIIQSCFANPSSNVIQDLINSGAISSAFEGQTCKSIQLEKDIREVNQHAMESFGDAATD